MADLGIIWGLIVVVPVLLGYVVSRISLANVRLCAFWALATLPIWAWTVTELISPPTWPSRHFDRWSLGMLLLTPVQIVWIVAAVLAYSLGKRNVR